jgi:alpha-glucosidase (family GH31 glycosyl hydrolase)
LGYVIAVRGFWVDDVLAVHPAAVDEAGCVSVPGAVRVGVVIPCGLDEHFAGLGEQFIQVDKRGRVVECHVGSSVNRSCHLTAGLDGGYKVAPLWYSSAGYAAFVHGTKDVRIEFAVSDPESVIVTVPGDEMRITVVHGSAASCVSQVTALTGRPPLAPPWAFAPWKAMRGGHQAVVAEADRLRSLGVGAGVVWLDAHYQPDTNSGFPCAGSYPMGSYPSMADTVAALHQRGLRAFTYVNPFLYRGTPAYDLAVERGYAVCDRDGRVLHQDMIHPFEGDLFGLLDDVGMHSLADGAAVIDLANPAALAWFQGMLRSILLDQGFDGWMQDFGEGVPEGAQGEGGEAHNCYPLLYHAASSEAVAASGKEAVFFARGGWLGAQGLAPAFWPGDQTRDWSTFSGLGSVAAAGISLGLMGVALWGPDIGGNMGFPALGGGLGGGSEDKELWLRWCQLGAVSPVMRDHLSFHVGTPVDLWTDDETVACWRACAEWHTGLFPYLYSAAASAASTGLPILRGLMLEFPDDPMSWCLADQYLLGDALLCAPVLERGLRERRVYLPAGDWVDTWTGGVLSGPGWVTVDAPLDRWPVLQRAGTVVARLLDVPLDLGDGRYGRGEFDLELRVAPGAGERRCCSTGRCSRWRRGRRTWRWSRPSSAAGWCGRPRARRSEPLVEGLVVGVGVGVLLELHDLAVADVPHVGGLDVEGLARGLDHAPVAALHDDRVPVAEDAVGEDLERGPERLLQPGQEAAAHRLGPDQLARRKGQVLGQVPTDLGVHGLHQRAGVALGQPLVDALQQLDGVLHDNLLMAAAPTRRA